MDDVISRHAAIDAIRASTSKYTGFMEMEMYTDDDAVEAIESLPSAQPEIIRCKDCKWKQGSECVRFADVRPFPDDFCSRAERRTDD